MRLALALLLALTASPALAEAITFSGSLGSREIVVELTQPSDGAVAGRYTFRDRGGDVPLVPVSHDDGVWILNEEAICGDSDCVLSDTGEVTAAPIAAVWELTYDPQTYIAKGTRTATGSKTKIQPLMLDAIAWRTLAEGETATAMSLHDRSAQYAYMDERPLDWANAPYEMTLLDMPLEGEIDQEMQGHTYNYVVDRRTKFAFPRAVFFADGSSVDAANAILSDQHFRMNLAALDCLALQYASYGVNSEWSIRGGHLADYDGETVTLTYLSPRLLSWQQSGSLWCTGAHPYNHIDSYTYDLTTGERFDLAKVFSAWVPREWGAAPEDIADTDLASENPDAYHWGPSPELIAYVRDNLPSELIAGDEEIMEVCYGEQEIADQLDIRFLAEPVPAAMFTGTGYPHVISMCNGDMFSVPLADLSQFLVPTARDYFPELAE